MLFECKLWHLRRELLGFGKSPRDTIQALLRIGYRRNSKRGHREYLSPCSYGRSAKPVSGRAWTVGRTIASGLGPPGFGPRNESGRECSPRPARLRLFIRTLANPSSKTETSPRQQSRMGRIRRDIILPAIDGRLR